MALAAHPRAWLRQRRARHEADYWIAHGFESRYAWRAAELTSRRERRFSARALANVIGELEGRKLPGAVPIRRRALTPHLPLLHQVERRLLDEEPVAAVGMLAVHTLLTSPDSCLFAQTDDVDADLQRVLVKLGSNGRSRRLSR